MHPKGTRPNTMRRAMRCRANCDTSTRCTLESAASRRPVMTSAAKLTAVGVTTGSLALASAHALPAVWFVPWLRRVLRPRLAGIGRAGGIALTFDDGPHPVATPAVLRVLRQHDVHATFFVLGEQ
ncbi:MAG: polysaccharide deacetylase family protein, partial [Sciscionella sp.]|nr:polysaccharide deacetylase family protein [Sciscionella sp.]